MSNTIPDSEMIGKKYHRLTVLSMAGRSSRKRYCNVKCDCGVEKKVVKHHLLDEKTKSCGCLTKERMLNQNKNKDSNFQRVFKTYIRSAKIRRLDFNLSKEEFVSLTQQNCHYCGEPPSNKCSSSKYQQQYIYNGIDRVDNRLGYIKENCVPCCFICNNAKHSMDYLTFTNWIKRIIKHNEN